MEQFLILILFTKMKKISLKTQHPLFLILFGAPGVGKGTFAGLITREYGIPSFSTGEYFRSLLKNTDN